MTRLGPPAAARRRHTYQDMTRYAAPPTASPRPSASSLVIPSPAPATAGEEFLTVTSPRPSGERPASTAAAAFSGATVIVVTDDPYEVARAAASRLAERTGVERHDALVVLGSGWAGAAVDLGDVAAEVDVRELPGFLRPVAQGHPGRIRSTRLRDLALLVVLGRTHLYEGSGPAPVIHAVRTAAAAGCRTAVLTNASGAIRQDWPPGTGVVLRDHLDLAAASPLVA